MRTVDKIANLIKEATSIAIICHTNPDPDTICSALALENSLQYLNKDAHVFCETTPQGKVALIEGVNIINKKYSPSYNVCICLDCSDIKRLGEDIDIFHSAKHTINIDHHKSNTLFAEYNHIEPYASSTAEMLYRLILRLDPECINDKVAKLLYTGMVADSGAFTFPSTSTDTMIIAGELMRYNFNASEVCYEMIKKMPKRVFNLKVRAINSLVTYENNKIGIINYKISDFKLTRTTMEDTSGIINEIINIENILIAISITETDKGSFKISIRSKGNIDASAVAEAYGGGGHKNAAGCELHGDYEEIIIRLLRESKKALCKA